MILIPFFLAFFWKYSFTFVFLTFLSFKFWFHYFHILVYYSIFGKHELGNCIIDQTGSTAFTTEFLTVANTLLMHISQRTKFQKNLRRWPGEVWFTWDGTSQLNIVILLLWLQFLLIWLQLRYCDCNTVIQLHSSKYSSIQMLVKTIQLFYWSVS